MCQLSTSVVSLHVGDDISFCLATPSACSCEMRLDDGRFLWLRRSDGVSLGSVCVCTLCVCVCEKHFGCWPKMLSIASHYCQFSGLAICERCSFSRQRQVEPSRSIMCSPRCCSQLYVCVETSTDSPVCVSVCDCLCLYVWNTVAEHTQLQLYTDRAFNPRHDSSLQVPHIHFLVT